MEKHNHLNEDMIKEYKRHLNNLSQEYNNNIIDIKTLELEYRKSTNEIAKKYGIATPHPFTSEYTRLDDYGKKEIEKSIGRRLPRPAIQRIIEDNSFTEPGITINDDAMFLLKESGFKVTIKGKKSKC